MPGSGAAGGTLGTLSLVLGTEQLMGISSLSWQKPALGDSERTQPSSRSGHDAIGMLKMT